MTLIVMALEEGHAHHALKLPDMVADRGLAGSQLLRSAREAPVDGRVVEVTQLLEVALKEAKRARALRDIQIDDGNHSTICLS